MVKLNVDEVHCVQSHIHEHAKMKSMLVCDTTNGIRLSNSLHHKVEHLKKQLSMHITLRLILVFYLNRSGCEMIH